jgi:hypothetical protein
MGGMDILITQYKELHKSDQAFLTTDGVIDSRCMRELLQRLAKLEDKAFADREVRAVEHIWRGSVKQFHPFSNNLSSNKTSLGPSAVHVVLDFGVHPFGAHILQTCACTLVNSPVNLGSFTRTAFCPQITGETCALSPRWHSQSSFGKCDALEPLFSTNFSDVTITPQVLQDCACPIPMNILLGEMSSTTVSA